MRTILFFSFSLLMLFSKMAAAYTCSTPMPTNLRSIPTITVARDASVGDILGASIPNITPFSCENNTPELTYQEFGVKAYGNYQMMISGRRVYSTNIPGIGYSVYAIAQGCNGSAFGKHVDGTDTIGGDVNTRLLCSAGGMINGGFTATTGIIFYKTGTVTSTGTVIGKTTGALVLRNNQSSWQSPESTFGFYSFTVQSTGCSVSKSNISVAMGDVKKSEFSVTGSSPASSFTKNVDIELACTANTLVSLQIDGNIQDAAKGLLKLNNVAGAATGVAIQLLYKSNPLTLGSKLFIGEAGTTMTIPLQARYYQTLSTIKSGFANSVATFTLTYQ
ncbi:MAG: hypothetical protein H6R25_3024 [Proteobacteria bacterium]|nr:hypothetical protein [Pseudomonadota bacterium]